MKLNIAPEEKEKLIRTRAALTETAAAIDEAMATLAKINADRPRLAEEVTRLEAETDYTDAGQVNHYALQATMLALLNKQQPMAESAIRQLPVKLFQHFSGLRAIIFAAIQPTAKEIKAKVAESLRASHGAGQALEETASQAPIVRSFLNFYERQWPGGPSTVLHYTPDAIALLDDLIEGKTTWTFESA